MISLNVESILTHLKKNNVEAKVQKETGQIVIMLKIASRDFPIFFRIFEGTELLQILAFVPCNTKDSTVADTARLLHLLNKEIDVPGFGMDEMATVVFYRCMIPAKDKQIDPSIFDAFFTATQIACKSFAPIIAAVASGGSTFDQIIRNSREQRKSVAETQLNAGN